MKRLLIITFFAIILAPSWGAEEGDSSLRFLRFQGGAGVGLYRDLGASPQTYRGVELRPAMSIRVEKPRWRYELALEAEGGAYGLSLGTNYIQAYGGVGELQFGVQRLVFRQDGWRLYAGVSLSEHFDIRYNASLGNANVGVTNYVAPALEGIAEWHSGRVTLHGDVSVLPFGVMLRPGFAYMDNFDRDIAHPTANMFGQYRCYMAGAVGLSTDVGIVWSMKNGNRVGMSYAWHYVTSRTDGHLAPHRFEQAAHGVVADFCFAI